MSSVRLLVTVYFLVDGMKLVVLGSTVETAGQVSSSTWFYFVNCKSISFVETSADDSTAILLAFFTAYFREEYVSYDSWLML
jgi:hypothetical protein